jgi:competence protein ComEA
MSSFLLRAFAPLRELSWSQDLAGPFLRRSDQAVLAAFGALALVGMIVARIAQGGPSGELTEIDEQQPRTAQFLVDINTADWPELTALPDIGEALARRIVADRKDHGPFRSHDDLDRVHGIGPKTIDRIRPYLLPVEEEEEE